MKLHLPKLLLTAVLAACVAPTAWADTGWADSGKGADYPKTLYMGGTDNNDGLIRNAAGGISGVTGTWADEADKVNLTTVVTSVDLTSATDNTIKGLTDFVIAADGGVNNKTVHVDATIKTLTVNDNSTIRVDVSGWGTRHFDNLLIENLVIKDGDDENADGSAIINVASTEVVTLGAVTGKYTAAVDGSLKLIGTHTYTAGGTVTGTGTLIVTDDAILTLNHGGQNGAVKSKLKVEAGGTLVSLKGDGLNGWGGDSQGPSVLTLAGEEQNFATVKVDNRQTIGRKIEMSGYAQIIENESTTNVAGSLELYKNGIVIEASGTDNVIATSVYVGGNGNVNTIDVLTGGQLEISGSVSNFTGAQGHGGALLKKSGDGLLRLSGINDLDEIFTNAGGSTEIAGDTTFDKGVDITAGKVKIDDGVTISLGKAIQLNGGSVEIGEATINIGDLSGFDFVLGDIDDSSLETTENGFVAADKIYTIIDGYDASKVSIDASAAFKYSNETITLTNGTYTKKAAGTGTVYLVNSGEENVTTLADSGVTDFIVKAHDNQIAGTLVIDGATASLTEKQILLTTIGNGNVTLKQNVQLNSGTDSGEATLATGQLTITNGAILTIGNKDLNGEADRKARSAKIDSFTSVVLDNGTIKVNNPMATIKNLTVASTGGTLEVYDLAGEATTDYVDLTETTTLNGQLTLSHTYNTIVKIAQLAGSGDIDITLNDGQPMAVYLNGKAAIGYTGDVKVHGKTSDFTLNIAENMGVTTYFDSTNGGLNLTGIKAGNTVDIKSVTGSYLKDGTINADVVLTNSDDNNSAALQITNGHSNLEVNFAGTVKDGSKAGNIVVTNMGNVAGITYKFSGDVSKWTGDMVIGQNGGSQDITYTGSATTINNSVIAAATGQTNQSTKLSFDHTAAATVNSQITNTYWDRTGTLNVAVKNSSDEGTTFTGSSISINSLTIEDKTLASFTGLNTLTLTDLTMKSGAQLNVGKGVAPAATTFSNGAKVTGTANLAGGAKVSGLDLSNATVLTLNGIGEGSLVNVTGEFVLPIGSLTLNGNILETLAAMTSGSRLNVFSVGSFTLGSESIAADFGAEKGYTLDTVFTGHDLGSDYYLGYTAPVDGGLGTVYIGKVVPEPTTAILSLLALAALAARRRRK